MSSIISGMQERINNINSHSNRYINGLIKAEGKKTCTDIAQAVGVSHDRIQRDLNISSEHTDELRAILLSKVTNKHKAGFVIGDSTLVVKEYAQSIEGVSRQHNGAKKETTPGIGLSAIIWTDLETVEPVDLFVWQKGDKSKVKTATDKMIAIAQRTNALAVLADAAYASVESLTQYARSGVFYVMRFHANRVVTVPGFVGSAPIKNHPAFKLTRNRRCIIRTVLWYGLKLRVIALKIKHKTKGWAYMFLVTNMDQYGAQKAAALYKHRWKIETFFRTCKQKFGLGDCQARSLKKQEAHYLNVFLAYSKFMSDTRESNRMVHKKPPIPTIKSMISSDLWRYA